MRIGVVFPQTEIGTDPAVIREFGQAAEQLGYHHILAYDHVLGANPASRPGWRPPYTHQSTFHEPFVLFSYLAGLTKTIKLVTGVLILPQRQTALVAKQSAALDVLSSGRFRLGIGIGWNPVEYEALGQNFSDRGQRSEEQVEVLRLLWTNELVTFNGQMAQDHRCRNQSLACPTTDSDLVWWWSRPGVAPFSTARRRLVSSITSGREMPRGYRENRDLCARGRTRSENASASKAE